MTPDNMDQPNNSSTPMTMNLIQEGTSQPEIGENSQAMKDQQTQESHMEKQIILQNDGQNRQVLTSNLNRSLQSSNSKSPIETVNEEINLKVGQHCYSPNVLSLKTDQEQNFVLKSLHPDDEQAAMMLLSNNHSSTPVNNKNRDSYYQRARREHYYL